MTTPAPVIEIRDLHKAYGALEVLKGVSIAAPKGHVVSLIGSSGSGKSTLLRCCNLLEDSQQGDVLFKGEPVAWRGSGHNRRPADAKQVLRIRTNLSMVFQQFNLWAHMTILQNVMEAPVTVLGRERADVEKAARGYLDKVGIGDKSDAYPAQLSGGQQQRLVIARAIAIKPTVLLLDEPASALDPISTLKIEELIHQLKDDYTIAIVTHNMQQAARVSDYTAFLYIGEMVEFGETDTIFRNPKSKQTEDYITGRYG